MKRLKKGKEPLISDLKIQDRSIDDPGEPIRWSIVFRDYAEQVKDGTPLNCGQPWRQNGRFQSEI